jgi:hypothetical protein
MPDARIPARPGGPKHPISAPGLSFVRFPRGFQYYGPREAVRAAGLVPDDILPGEPGQRRRRRVEFTDEAGRRVLVHYRGAGRVAVCFCLTNDELDPEAWRLARAAIAKAAGLTGVAKARSSQGTRARSACSPGEE